MSGVTEQATQDLPAIADLRRALAGAADLAAACLTACDLLVAAGLPLPSVYLARSGRLRCVAVRGYWQAFDGIPPYTGVIGTVWATGEPRHLRGVGQDPIYLAVSGSVHDEVCVPLRVGGTIVGALNVESTTSMRLDALALVRRVGDALEQRLTELGGPGAETPARRLARHAAVLATCRTQGEVVRRALDAALDLTGMSSALLGLRDPAAPPGVAPALAGATGPLGAALSALDGALAVTASWVASGASVYTVGNPAGHLFDGSRRLRDAGAAAVVVLPLGTPDTPQGVLVVADGGVAHPATLTVEVLELLAGLTTAALHTAALMAQLEDRASRDPLTGLGHQGTFGEVLAEAVRRARGSTWPEAGAAAALPAVLMADLDGFKAVNDSHGHLAGDRVLQRVALAMASLLREGDLHRVGGDEFAAVVWVADAEEAVAVAERLRSAVAGTSSGVTLSVGVAVVAAGEDSDEPVARADAALYRAKSGGRDRVVLAAVVGAGSIGR